METAVPSGYKFNPTDQELIWHYLYKKVNGKPLPCNEIIDCDIYGGDSTWRKMFDDREEESLYFFTKLRNWSTQKNGRFSSRVVRATKLGTWRCQSDMKIYAGKKHVGSKRTFSFIEKEKKEEEEPKKKGSKKTNGWTMHEYRIDGCLMHQKENSSSDYGYVVSRISRPRSMRRDEGESISSQIASELDAPFPEELNTDNNKGESIRSQIEFGQDALFPEELNQDNNKEESISSQIEFEQDALFPEVLNQDYNKGELIISQIEFEQDALFLEELNQDNNKGESISSQLEFELDALFPGELNQDNNNVEVTEMLPGYSIEVDINDEWLSCLIEEPNQENNKGESISSQIEFEQDALFLEELNPDNNNVEGTEMLPSYSNEVDINDEWLLCFLNNTDLDNFSFLWQ